MGFNISKRQSTMEEGQLLDITMTATQQLDVNSIQDKLEAEIKGALDKVELPLKVLGENRFLLVVSNENVEEVTRKLNKVPGLSLKTTPLVNYETFGKILAGMQEASLPEKKPPAMINPAKPLFFLDLTLEYEGKSMEELVKAWMEEATAALSLMYGGQVPAKLYKVVASRQVVVCLQMEIARLEGMFFNLPIMQSLGNQAHWTARVVKLITK